MMMIMMMMMTMMIIFTYSNGCSFLVFLHIIFISICDKHSISLLGGKV